MSDVGREFEGLLTYLRKVSRFNYRAYIRLLGAANAATLTPVQPCRTSIVLPATHITNVILRLSRPPPR